MRKGRPSILNNSPMKMHLFRIGACPSIPEIDPGSAFKIQCDFASIFSLKMTPLGFPLRNIFVTKPLRDFGPGDFFVECSPPAPPKPPEAAPRGVERVVLHHPMV